MALIRIQILYSYIKPNKKKDFFAGRKCVDLVVISNKETQKLFPTRKYKKLLWSLRKILQQYPQGAIIRGAFIQSANARGQYSSTAIPWGANNPKAIIQGTIVQGTIFLGGNYDRGQLSWGQSSRGELSGSNFSWGNFPDTLRSIW